MESKLGESLFHPHGNAQGGYNKLMGPLPALALARRLPLVLLATFVVIGLPVLVVSELRASGVVSSFPVLIGIGMALSVAASSLGAKAWARIHSGDLLFTELMIWGWVRRWRVERQLASAIKMLGLEEEPAGKTVGAKGKSSNGDTRDMTTETQVSVLKRLASGLEGRYPDTHGHSRRVARHATLIAKRMGLSSEEVARIRTAASVHDVGKIDLSPSIINKPGKLTDAEFSTIKKHSTIGAEMVTSLGDEKLTEMVRHHHERLDGTGYPDGLAGKEIPLGARIIAVADTFDALTSTRAYRDARRHKEALGVLAAEAGSQLDPAAVRAFRSYYTGYRPAAIWGLFLNGPRQLLATLAGEAKLGGVAAATVATVAAGNLAVHSFHADHAVSQPVTASQAAALSPQGQHLVAMLQRGGLEDRQAVGAKGSRIALMAMASDAPTAGFSFGGGGKETAASGEASTPAGSQEGASSPTAAQGSLTATKGGGKTSPAPTTSPGDSKTSLGEEPQGGEGESQGSAGKGDSSAKENNGGGNSGKGNSAGKGNSSGKGNSGNSGNSSKGNSGGNGNSAAAAEGDTGHRGESVALPTQASSKAGSAVEGVVKGGGSSKPAPPSTPPSPPVSPPSLPPQAAAPTKPETPVGPPPGKGKQSALP